MRILIFGISGLIGSGIYFNLSNKNNLNVFGTKRKSSNNFILSKNNNNIFNFEINENSVSSEIENLIKMIVPDYVINCIGITKHIISSYHKKNVYLVNSEFPQILKKLCTTHNSKLIQISTDCVFQGSKGNYNESDDPDATDLYATSKIQGELNDANHLTIRTSTVGYELGTKYGLLEWFLEQTNSCNGYTKAFFSGISTLELSEIIYNYVISSNLLNGLIHISSKKISKYDLLNILKINFKKKIDIHQYHDFFIDRSLDNSKFKTLTNYQEKSWQEMSKELKKIENFYIKS
tara:strand:- start:756 stop:1631 length:876 start_codon:yes stop_codon:yes gene_type:complete